MSNEEGNMQKKKKKVDVVKCRSRPYYFRRCKHTSLSLSSTTNINSLPDELVFLILLELEVEEIYNSAMLVCRRWYKIVRAQDFVQEHVNHSSSGLLILEGRILGDITFKILSGRGRRIHTFKRPRIFGDNLKFWGTCNGLTLEEYPYNRDSDIFFVVNYAINKRIQLPPLAPARRWFCYFSCIGYAPASEEYKVVYLYDPVSEDSKLARCAVLTLGVDKSWRYIDTQHISAAGADLLRANPLITEGFVHWAQWGRTCLLSLNLENEIFNETLIPEEGRVHPEFNHYLSTWKSLTLLIASPVGLLSWDVWELLMKPNTESGEWRKVVKIDLEGQRCRFDLQSPFNLLKEMVMPVGWLNCMEVLVLGYGLITDKVCVLYDVGTLEIEFLDLGYVGRADLHKNSFVWFGPT